MEYSDLSSTLLALLDSVLLPRSCAYVAGPLESGQLYYEQIAAGVKTPNVRDLNESRLEGFVHTLRARLPYPVFDPGTLKVCGWTESEHGVFFLTVLERIAKEAWFVDGWEFSHGATKEFILCTKLGIPCFTEKACILDFEQGRSMIFTAVKYLESLGVNAERLRSRLQ